MQQFRSIASELASLLLALILAVAIWATAVRANDPVDTDSHTIDIQIVGKPADAELVVRPPSSALITIQGPTSALEETLPGDFTGFVDLSDLGFGEFEVPIEVEGDHEQIEVLSIFPETANIQIEQIVTRDIPINVVVRGEEARGHQVGEYRVEPDTVQITGPAPRVDALVEGRVTVFVDNARDDITETRRPNFYDSNGELNSIASLDVQPPEVEVIVPVIELAGFAEKPVSVDWVGEPAAGYRLLNVSVEPNTVQVTGAPTQLEGLRVQTEPVDINGLTATETRQVSLDLPDGISLVEVQPVVVTVEIEPILSSDIVERPVEIRSLGPALTATLEPDQVRVFLFGPLPVLDALAEDDIRVTVDLLNLISGTHLVEPFVSVAIDAVEVRSTQPAQITVIISDVITATDELTETASMLDIGRLVWPAGGTAGTGGPSSGLSPGMLRAELAFTSAVNRVAILPRRNLPV